MTDATYITISIDSTCTLPTDRRVVCMRTAVDIAVQRKCLRLGLPERWVLHEASDVATSKTFAFGINRVACQFSLEFGNSTSDIVIQALVDQLQAQYLEALGNSTRKSREMAELFRSMRIEGVQLDTPQSQVCDETLADSLIPSRRVLESISVQSRYFKFTDGTRLSWDEPAELWRSLFEHFYPEPSSANCLHSLDVARDAADVLLRLVKSLERHSNQRQA